MEANESYIVTGIRNKEKEAFHYLYEHYYSPMVMYAGSYLYDEEEARDCVQELFYRLWDRAPAFHIDTSLRAYLYTSLRHKCLNVLRDRKIRDSHQDKLFEATLFSGEEDPGMDETVRKRLDEALEALPGRCKEVFLMKILEGKKNREIADQMGLAETTVKTQVQRAYRMLREKLLLLGWLLLLLKEL